MESDGNQLSSCDPVWNAICKYTVQPKHCFYVGPGKRQKCVDVLIITVDITIIDVKFWTQKKYMPQFNYIFSLTQPEITRQIPFKLIYIEYDIIKY